MSFKDRITYFNNRLEHLFARKEHEESLAFVSFFMGCDPTYKKSLSILLEAAESGSDILEIGFANSEASSEGPIIQTASERALKAGGSLNQVIKLAADVRKKIKKLALF